MSKVNDSFDEFLKSQGKGIIKGILVSTIILSAIIIGLSTFAIPPLVGIDE
jgi:hypothetical protein